MVAAPHININARYQSLAELKAASPTLADGLSEAQEGVLRREQYRTVLNAGRRLVLPARVPGTAMVFMHRFFARNSMVRYNPLIMAMACLLLASKSEDIPKRLVDIIRECWRARHDERRDAVESSRPDDKGWLAEMEKQVRIAERALLYQLAFVVDAPLPYAAVDTMVQHAQHFDERAFPNRAGIIQSCWNFINDSWRTTLCLQYDHQTLAAAAMWLAFKLHRVEPVLEEGEPWFTRLLHVELENVQGIVPKLMQLYEDAYRDSGSKLSPTAQAALVVEQPEIKVEPRAEPAS